MTRGGETPAGLRGVPAPARRRPGRADLRDDGLRHPSSSVAEAVALTPGIESPTVLAPAPRGLGRGARHGAAAGRAAADGRALRHRRPRHPAHRHPCLPSLSRQLPAHLATVRGPDGRGALRRSAAGGVRVRVVLLRRRDPRPRSRRSSAAPWCSSGCSSSPPASPWRGRGSSPRPTGWSSSTATAATTTSGRRCWRSTCRPARPWAVLDLADGTSQPAMGIQGSDGARARRAVAELRLLLAPVRLIAGATDPGRRPGRRRAPGCDGARSARPRPRPRPPSTARTPRRRGPGRGASARRGAPPPTRAR